MDWRWVRPLAAAGLLAFLLARVGTGPFVDGVRLVDAPAMAAALGIGALTTVCSAWRWQLVARGLGVPLRLPTAVADCCVVAALACSRTALQSTGAPPGAR